MIFAKIIMIQFLCAFDTLPAVLPGSVHAVWYRPQSFHRREKSSWGQEHRAAHQNHHDPLHPVHTLCPVSRAATNDYCNHILFFFFFFFKSLILFFLFVLKSLFYFLFFIFYLFFFYNLAFKMFITVFQSPKWCFQDASIVQPTVHNQQTLLLLS